jgi:gas vesicle protein
MAQTAGQLATRQKQQANHVRDLVKDQATAQTSGKQAKQLTKEELEKMVSDRQQVADDLSHLTRQMRDAARELAPTQPGSSSKLRGALNSLDENDLGTRLQRSSDYLRSAKRPRSTAQWTIYQSCATSLTASVGVPTGSPDRVRRDRASLDSPFKPANSPAVDSRANRGKTGKPARQAKAVLMADGRPAVSATALPVR